MRTINLSDSDFCEVIRLLNSLSDEIKLKMDALDIDNGQELYSSLLLNRADILSLKRRIEESAMRNYYKSNGLSDSEADSLISKLLK